tara:strand:- start:11163 stop:11447 length:285 start_codon:yes stop_codon:yes gene_type:complete
MRQQPATFATLGGLVCISVLVTMTGARVIDLDSRIARLITTNTDNADRMPTLTEQVKRPSGRITTVTTPALEGETPDAHLARHDALVALARASG